MIRILLLSLVIACIQSDAGWRKLELDARPTYNIIKEDEIYFSDFDLPNDTIRASLTVSDGDLHDFSKIMLSNAMVKNDTLVIELYTTDSAYHHEYKIFIVGNMYRIRYWFAVSPGYVNGTLEPLQTKLKLNANQIAKGVTIRGYTEFKTKCIQPCTDGLLVVAGNFKAIVR